MTFRSARFASAGLVLLACTQAEKTNLENKTAAPSTDEPKAAASVVAPLQEGWLRTLAEQPDAAQSILDSECWSSFFGGDYRDALEKAEDNAVDMLCQARVYLAMGEMYAEQARLLAAAQHRAIEAKMRKTNAPPVDVEPFYGAVGQLWSDPTGGRLAALAKTKKIPSSHRPLAVGLSRPCPKGKGVLGGLRCRIEGRAYSSCGPAKVPKGIPAAWKKRLRTYHSALCERGLSAVDDLVALAAQPTAERSVTDASTNLKAKVEFHDPLALLVLSDIYLQAAEKRFAGADEAGLLALTRRRLGGQAECAAVGPGGLAALIFSRWQTYEDVRKECVALNETGVGVSFDDPARKDQQLLYDGWKATVQTKGSDEGRALVGELELVDRADRDAKRAFALRMSNGRPGCIGALDLLQSTRDPEQPDQIGARNSPVFVSRLTSRAVCANRFAEARLILGRLAERFPAFKGTESAVVRLAIAEGIGPDDEPKR